MDKSIKTLSLMLLFCLSAAYGMETPKQRPDHSNSIITISQQELVNNDIELKNKLIQGAIDGIFYVEMPNECKNLTLDALNFGNSFYTNEAIKDQKFPGFTGYHNREHAQVESFYAERSYWKEVLPEKIIQLATYMHLLSAQLLKKILKVVIPHVTTDQLCIGTEK